MPMELMVMTYSLLGLLMGYYILFVASNGNIINDKNNNLRSSAVQIAVTLLVPDSERDLLLSSQQQHQHQHATHNNVIVKSML
jgi:hypothetical protein